MKVTYIKHSGFLLEWENCVWLFDYYNGKIPEIPREKKVVVFVSHSHGDHFNPVIFDKFAGYPQAEYVMASETRHKVKKLSLPEEQACRIAFLKPHQSWSTDDGVRNKIMVETLHSTDCGVAFLAEYEGKKIYHAGDLNWWVWKGESKQEYNDMTAKFQREIQRLKEKTKAVDAAFVPLDPRQEEWYRLGMDYFLEQIDAERVFPMHFWEEYDVIEKYRKEQEKYENSVVPISREGFEVTLW
ncbi:MAG: MBL fold metallo-hydrolase [Ruminococcus sp.]|jgi:L-ascorbate metabolism protein UlaG (beta-lactamase superfamily)